MSKKVKYKKIKSEDDNGFACFDNFSEREVQSYSFSVEIKQTNRKQ